jgi:hypothetical protein
MNPNPQPPEPRRPLPIHWVNEKPEVLCVVIRPMLPPGKVKPLPRPPGSETAFLRLASPGH